MYNSLKSMGIPQQHICIYSTIQRICQFLQRLFKTSRFIWRFLFLFGNLRIVWWSEWETIKLQYTHTHIQPYEMYECNQFIPSSNISLCSCLTFKHFHPKDSAALAYKIYIHVSFKLRDSVKIQAISLKSLNQHQYLYFRWAKWFSVS